MSSWIHNYDKFKFFKLFTNEKVHRDEQRSLFTENVQFPLKIEYIFFFT